MLKALRLDWFLIAIVAAAALATVLPATGVGVGILAWAVKAAIFVLFFLYGARLHRTEALLGLRHWRLHLSILAFTFVAFPLLGLALRPLEAALLPNELVTGLFYVCLLPSTVQSSIAFTSIARGNVAGAIVSASASNLLGVVVTPALAFALLSTNGGTHFSGGAVLDIAAQILLPFLLGQLSQRWTHAFVNRYAATLKLVDRGSIVLVVYSAFSAGSRDRMWAATTPLDLVILVAICLVILAIALSATWLVARRLGFDVADAIAIQFCGSKKSMATGLPMAQVLFAGASLGLIVLPLVIFHQAQLMACSALAQRYARRPVTAPDAG